LVLPQSGLTVHVFVGAAHVFAGGVGAVVIVGAAVGAAVCVGVGSAVPVATDVAVPDDAGVGSDRPGPELNPPVAWKLHATATKIAAPAAA